MISRMNIALDPSSNAQTGEMLVSDHAVATSAMPRSIPLRASKIPMPVSSFVFTITMQVVTSRPGWDQYSYRCHVPMSYTGR